jgi:hypothetical protein
MAVPRVPARYELSATCPQLEADVRDEVAQTLSWAMTDRNTWCLFSGCVWLLADLLRGELKGSLEGPQARLFVGSSANLAISVKESTSSINASFVVDPCGRVPPTPYLITTQSEADLDEVPNYISLKRWQGRQQCRRTNTAGHHHSNRDPSGSQRSDDYQSCPRPR